MKKYIIRVLILIAALLLNGCVTTAPASASCAFVVGDGSLNQDTNVHEVVYPGQKVTHDDTEIVRYVPCNSRNYIINDGTVRNANGELVGDRFNLIEATTRTGVPIEIAARAFWTLNQTDRAMRKFYNVCFKYTCFSTEDVGGNANFSTAGWNGMLAENFGPAMDAAARVAAYQVEDSIWQIHDPGQYDLLGEKMEEAFADAMRGNLGYDDDLFCSSGNSDWSNPEEPGVNQFTCNRVRIVVDEVRRGEVFADDSSAGVASINEQRLKNAQALYGSNAGYWLALQDSIETCKNANVPCVFNIGGMSGSPALTLPAMRPTPLPTATPVPEE